MNDERLPTGRIGLTSQAMRPIRLLLIYLIIVFAGGALLAPWLYWAASSLAPHSPAFAKLASNPFARFVNRALLGTAIIGIWPLLRSCGMLGLRETGYKPAANAGKNISRGFLVGFASLAIVAVAAACAGGRSWNLNHNGTEIIHHLISAALSAVIVAILEELIFRGTLFGIIRKGTSWIPALIVSSAIYSLVHFLQKAELIGPVTWHSGLDLLPKMFLSGPPLVPMALTLFTAGSILALAYQRTGTLYFSIGLHAGWIFWLKSYSFLTNAAPGGNALIWGSDRLIDGWLALPILGVVFLLVDKTKIARRD